MSSTDRYITVNKYWSLFSIIFAHENEKYVKIKSSIILQPICTVACGDLYKGGGPEQHFI
jgi:hypothetical protein